MAYRVELSRHARKDLDALRPPVYARVRSALEGLREDPRPRGSVKLAVRANTYRVRVGVYRIAYVIDDDRQVIEVRAIQHRKDVYRDL